MREDVAADIRSVFNADTLARAEARLDDLVEKYHKSAPELSNWIQTANPRRWTFSEYRLDSQARHRDTPGDLRRMGDR
ncbi:MAG: transposase-like protein [Lentimonas sp.]|jgi:transposase-like protein